MRKKQLTRIFRHWAYSETSGMKDKVERRIDPTMMINKTLI